MENKRPTGRKRNVTGKADSIHRRGENLGTGPVGNSHPNNFGGKTENIHVTGKTGSGRNLKRGGSALSLVAIAALLLFGGNNLLGGGQAAELLYQPLHRPHMSHRQLRRPNRRQHPNRNPLRQPGSTTEYRQAATAASIPDPPHR